MDALDFAGASMDDNFIKKFADRHAASVPATELEEEATLDCGAFGWARGLRERCLMLQLRKANGNIRAISYALIDQLDFDPSVGITISAAGQRIVIKGRNLNAEVRPDVRLFDGLTRHRIPWLREATYQEGVKAAAASCVINAVEW
jgi:hypothetical protein